VVCQRAGAVRDVAVFRAEDPAPYLSARPRSNRKL
jgi:hypothetical protein